MAKIWAKHMSLKRICNLPKCEKGLAALEFAVLAPVLLMLVFSVIVYSIYFTTLYGVRQASSEGARAALAGLSSAERTTLATQRAQAVAESFRAIAGGSSAFVVQTGTEGSDVFKVTVSYDMSGSPIMRYAGFLPLPSTTVEATTRVTNGSY